MAKLLKPHIIPGFQLTFAFTLFYLFIIVLIPLSGIFFKTFSLSFPEFWQAVTSPRVLHAFKISFGISLFAAFINLFLGFLIAWVIVRYQFPGKKLMDAMVDLPFALPTAIAGIALTALYVPDGWIGRYLGLLGLQVASRN